MKSILLLGLLFALVVLVNCKESLSHLLMLEQPDHFNQNRQIKLEIRTNYTGSINFVESNEFKVLINTTASDLDEVYSVQADLEDHYGGLLIQVYEKTEPVIWVKLDWIIIVIGGLTGIVFLVSCVLATCSYHSEHSLYDSIEGKSYTSDSQRIVFRSRSSMHSSTQGEHALNDDGDNYQNDDTLKRVPELPDEEAAAEAIEMEELRKKQKIVENSDDESDTEDKNLIKHRYQSLFKNKLEKKGKLHSHTDKDDIAGTKDLDYSSDGSNASDKALKRIKTPGERMYERQKIEGFVVRPKKEMSSTYSEGEITRPVPNSRTSSLPVSASLEQNKLTEAYSTALARTTPKENLGRLESPITDDGSYPFVVQADVHLHSVKSPVATSSPMSTFKNPSRKVAFADADLNSEIDSSISFQNVFDKFLSGTKEHENLKENQDTDSAISSASQSAYGGSEIYDTDRLYMNISGSDTRFSATEFKTTRTVLPPSLVAGARRQFDSSGNSVSSNTTYASQQGRNGDRLNTFGIPKPWSPVSDVQRSSLDSGITSSNGTLWQSSASSDTGNSSPPLPPPPDRYEEESGMQFDLPSPPMLCPSSEADDQEEQQYQNTPVKDKRSNGQRGGGKGSKFAHMTFLSLTCILSLLTGVYCVKLYPSPRVDITIYTPKGYLSNMSTIFTNVEKDCEVINEMNIPLQQYNIPNPILSHLMSDLCDNHDCEQGCDEETGLCICKKGYKLDDARQCIDINECMEGGARCHKDAGCLNNKGSYNCICSGEFYGDGKNCRECRVPCVRGKYEYQSCGQNTQKICKACKSACPKGFFMNRPCDMKHNAECKVCKPSKCSKSDFEYRMCANRQDRECRDRKMLKLPVGSKNTIIESLYDVKNDTKIIEYIRPSDFIGLRTYTIDRGTGLKVEVHLTTLQASQLFVPVNYSSYQSDGLPPGANLHDFRRYCPHPVPSYYKLFYEKHKNITYSIDENNQVQPCETYRMFGKFPTARNHKEQSFLAVEPGAITNIFEINPTFFKYSTIWVHKSKRCMRYSDGCDNCTIQCVVKMKNNDDCKIKGDDNDNGWSPRLQVCYNCCAKQNCTESCKEYHKKHCQSKNVECRKGTVAEFRIQPQWNTSLSNYFFCHIQPKKQQKLLKISYAVQHNGKPFYYKEVELYGDQKWETEGKMTYNDDILAIVIDGKTDEMPNFLEGEFAGNKELLRVGVYKNTGSTVQSTVINGQSILVRPTKPFGLFGISTGSEAFRALLNSTVATEREVPYDSNPDLMVVTIENASYPYIVTHKNAAPVLKFDVPSSVSLLRAVFNMGSLKRKTIEGDLRHNYTHWLFDVKGRLHNCPGLLKIDVINQYYPLEPLYECDVAVLCPKVFHIQFAIPSNDDPMLEKEMTVAITDNTTTYHLRVLKPGQSQPDIDVSDDDAETSSIQPVLSGKNPKLPTGVIFSIPFIASICGAVILLLFLATFGFGLGLGSLPDIPVLRWYHVVMSIIYITFKFMYSLVATFTVFSLVLVVVNREPVSLVMDYKQQSVARSAIQHLNQAHIEQHVTKELSRQNMEANKTKSTCLEDMTEIVADVDRLHDVLLEKMEKTFKNHRIPELLKHHTDRVTQMLSQDLHSFRSKFKIYTDSLIDQINDDVRRSYNSIRQNSWLSGARFLHASIKNIRSYTAKVETKPFMEWSELFYDLSKLNVDLRSEIPSVPDVQDLMSIKYNNIKHTKSQNEPEIKRIRNVKVYNQWSTPFHKQRLNNTNQRNKDSKEISDSPVTFYAFLATLIIVDTILFLHRFFQSISISRLLIFGYPEYIDCRSSNDKPLDNDVFEEEQPKKKKAKINCLNNSVCQQLLSQVFATLFVPKSIMTVVVCLLVYVSMMLSNDLLNIKSITKLGLNYGSATYQDLQSQMINTRIIAHAHQINTVEYPSYLNWMSAYIERHKFALHLHQKQQQALGNVHNHSYCQYIKYLNLDIECEMEKDDDKLLSISSPGCKFPPIQPQLYIRTKSLYNQAASIQLESLLSNMRLVISNTCQVIILFLSIMVLKELFSAVLWLYLKRSNRLRLRIIYEKNDTHESSVINNTS